MVLAVNRIKILRVAILIVVLMAAGAPLVVNALLGKRILSTLHKAYPGYEIGIGKVRWSLLPSQLTLKNITFATKVHSGNGKELKGQISSIQFRRIRYIKALFKKVYDINEIIIANTSIQGVHSFDKQEEIAVVSTFNLQIGKIYFDTIDVSLHDRSTSQSLTVRDGKFKIMHLEIEQHDTIGTFDKFDFFARQITTVTPDSLYSFRGRGIEYADTLKALSIEQLTVDPNYEGYDFTSRNAFETDRIAVDISDVKLFNFSAPDCYHSARLKSSFISIGNIDMEAFRDKRKADNDNRKPAFQEYLYNFPLLLDIDSMVVHNGHVTYSEHAVNAKEPGTVNLSELKVRLYNITNDTSRKINNASVKLLAEAMLMGKSKLNVTLTAPLFDPQNSFTVNGALGALDVKELNPILEKSAHLYANTAKIEKMDFHFTANNTKAQGEMIMLYNGLDIKVMNKRTHDTSGLKERLLSLIVNKGAINSNPLPSEETRVGIIDYERDPTKFFFNYCLKSVETGILSTVFKHQDRKKTFLQRMFTGKRDNKRAETRD